MKALRLSSLKLGALTAPILALALALSGCDSSPLPATPALWHVTSPTGEEGWLFGTIHAAPRPVNWRTQTVDEALSHSGLIVVEVANIADDASVASVFAELSQTPNLPPVEQRVSAEQRARLSQMMADRGIQPDALKRMETWAVALTLARPSDSSNPAHGIDRAILASAAKKPVLELEGANAQLSIFDTLPETEQRDLLGYVLADGTALDNDANLLDTWRKGDMAKIEAETQTGMLADPELRDALLTKRNNLWLAQIDGSIRKGQRPFVAVGAAHMVGSDGLINLLQAKGYIVTRLQ